MFEKEIKFIGDFCFNQVKSLGSSFTLDKLTSAGVHPAIVQYISAELDYMIYSDRRKLLQQSYFDYAGKEISDHFQKISSEIKKHKKISLEDSKKLIFQAVSFNINYLVRPRWSLIKLIFNDQPLISVEELRMLLNYLFYYEYFKKVLSGYFLKRNLVQISSTEFDILLNKIDNELINSNQHEVISNSFTSMGDFFNIGGVDKNTIPLNAAEIFCKEKNLADLILKLRKAIPGDVKRRYSKAEIERILFSPDVIQKYEKETETETESKTEQMIEALDAELSGEVVEDELVKSEVETFLSPEEEEALLSLYNEEISENVDNDETVLASDSETGIEEIFEDLDGEGVKTALGVVTTSDSDLVPDIDETNKELHESAAPEETDFESSENKTEDAYQDVISSTEELEGVDDAIDEEPKENESTYDEAVVDQIEFPESDIDTLAEESEEEQPNTGFEKEIVNEMIKDFYGENISETEEEANDEEEMLDEIQDSVREPESTEEKIRSLEDDLLNIFEGLDEEEFKISDKERFTADVPEEVENFDETVGEEKTIETDITDGLDEYLKSIDEVIFADKSKYTPQETKSSTVEEKIDTEIKKIEKVYEVEKVKEKEKVEEKESLVPQNKIDEKPPEKTRVLRKKDMFSYLKRKEVKKIISYIFANDEEDFTNTVERIMDCHSYKEASEILKAVFTSYKISPYSKEAITFTNAVSNYFRQV